MDTSKEQKTEDRKSNTKQLRNTLIVLLLIVTMLAIIHAYNLVTYVESDQPLNSCERYGYTTFRVVDENFSVCNEFKYVYVGNKNKERVYVKEYYGIVSPKESMENYLNNNTKWPSSYNMTMIQTK